MSQFSDDKNSAVDPMQKSIVSFLSGGDANPNAMPSKNQDCLEISDKLEGQEGLDFSEGHSIQDMELHFPAADDYTGDRKDDRFALFCESRCSASSSIAEKFMMNDSYLDEVCLTSILSIMLRFFYNNHCFFNSYL